MIRRFPTRIGASSGAVKLIGRAIVRSPTKCSAKRGRTVAESSLCLHLGTKYQARAKEFVCAVQACANQFSVRFVLHNAQTLAHLRVLLENLRWASAKRLRSSPTIQPSSAVQSSTQISLRRSVRGQLCLREMKSLFRRKGSRNPRVCPRKAPFLRGKTRGIATLSMRARG